MHQVRIAGKEDMSSVLHLVKQLAIYEKEPDAVAIDENELIKHGTWDSPLFTCFIAEVGEQVVGMALVYFRFSTWNGRTLHLEDLFVLEEFRGTGIGKSLFDHVMLYGRSQNVGRVEWVVLDWNKPAIDFYVKNGATLLKDWYLVQMDQKSLCVFTPSGPVTCLEQLASE